MSATALFRSIHFFFRVRCEEDSDDLDLKDNRAGEEGGVLRLVFREEDDCVCRSFAVKVEDVSVKDDEDGEVVDGVDL